MKNESPKMPTIRKIVFYVIAMVIAINIAIYSVFNGRTTLTLGVNSNIPSELKLTVKEGNITFSGAEKIKTIKIVSLGTIPWDEAFEQTLEQAKKQNNVLYILMEKNFNMIQTSYEINKNFRITVDDKITVRRIASINGNIIAFVELQSGSYIQGQVTPDNIQRLKVGDQAFVCTKFDRLNVRNNPNLSASIISTIYPQTLFTIIDGPVYADNAIWWRIRISDGIIGWVKEGGDEVDPYFICPID